MCAPVDKSDIGTVGGYRYAFVFERGGIRGLGEMYFFTDINPYPNKFDSSLKARIGPNFELVSLYGDIKQKNTLRGNYR